MKKDEKKGDINGAVGEEPLRCIGGTITEEGECKCPEGTIPSYSTIENKVTCRPKGFRFFKNLTMLIFVPPVDRVSNMDNPITPGEILLEEYLKPIGISPRCHGPRHRRRSTGNQRNRPR